MKKVSDPSADEKEKRRGSRKWTRAVPVFPDDVVLSCVRCLDCWLGVRCSQRVAFHSMQFRSRGFMTKCMLAVPVSHVGVVRCLLVLLGLIELCCLVVMVSRSLMMTSGIMEMFPSL